MSGDRLPVGEAIDHAVKMVRGHRRTARRASRRRRPRRSWPVALDIRREGSVARVHEERRTLDPTRPLLGRPTSCVGRERELSILEAALADCRDGEGPKVLPRDQRLGRRKVAPAARVLTTQPGATGRPSRPSVPRRPDAVFKTLRPQRAARATGGGTRGTRIRRQRVVQALGPCLRASCSEAHAGRVNDFLGEVLGASFGRRRQYPPARRAPRRSGDGRPDRARVRGHRPSVGPSGAPGPHARGLPLGGRRLDQGRGARALEARAGTGVFVLALSRGRKCTSCRFRLLLRHASRHC